MSSEHSKLTPYENAYCWAVGVSTIAFIAMLMVIAATKATKTELLAIPAYGIVFTHLALFLVGITMEVAYRRWPVPAIVILCTVLSGIIGILLTLPLILPVP